MHIVQRLEKQVKRMYIDFAEMKSRLGLLETESKHWGQRYARRIAFSSNVLIGTWILVSQIVVVMRGRIAFKALIAEYIAGRSLRILTRGSQAAQVQALLREAALKGLRPAIVFYLSAFLLSNQAQGRRNLGVLLGSLASLFFASRGWHINPFGNYLNLFCNLVYASAQNWHLAPLFISWGVGTPTVD